MEILDENFKQESPETKKVVDGLKIDSMDPVKLLKSTRIGLIFLAVLNVIGAVVGVSTGNDIIGVAIESIILIGTYVFSYLIMPKKPVLATVLSGTVYLFYNILLLIVAPEIGMKSLIFKGIVLVAFVRSVMAAIKFEKLRTELKEYGEDLTFDEVKLSTES